MDGPREGPADDDLQTHYQRMKESVKRVESELGIKDERSEKLAELEKRQEELQRLVAEHEKPAAPSPQPLPVQHALAQLEANFVQKFPEFTGVRTMEEMQHRAHALLANNPARSLWSQS